LNSLNAPTHHPPTHPHTRGKVMMCCNCQRIAERCDGCETRNPDKGKQKTATPEDDEDPYEKELRQIHTYIGAHTIYIYIYNIVHTRTHTHTPHTHTHTHTHIHTHKRKKQQAMTNEKELRTSAEKKLLQQKHSIHVYVYICICIYIERVREYIYI
jgi:hypothetical protein